MATPTEPALVLEPITVTLDPPQTAWGPCGKGPLQNNPVNRGDNHGLRELIRELRRRHAQRLNLARLTLRRRRASAALEARARVEAELSALVIPIIAELTNEVLGEVIRLDESVLHRRVAEWCLRLRAELHLDTGGTIAVHPSRSFPSQIEGFSVKVDPSAPIDGATFVHGHTSVDFSLRHHLAEALAALPPAPKRGPSLP